MVFYSCATSTINRKFPRFIYIPIKQYGYSQQLILFGLAEKKINYFFDGLGPILIPFKTVVEIIRIFEGKDGKIDILFDKKIR